MSDIDLPKKSLWRRVGSNFTIQPMAPVVVRSKTMGPGVQIDTMGCDGDGQDVVEDLSNTSFLDRALVKVVDWTGTVYMFIFMWVVLVVWIVFGVIYKTPDTWQIIMQDGQSIQTYAWDTLLMRQQFDDSGKFLKLYGRLKSRYSAHERLLKRACRSEEAEMEPVSESKEIGVSVHVGVKEDQHSHKKATIVNSLDKLYDRICTVMRRTLGSLPMLAVYWIGIFIWVGCGALWTASDNSPPYTGDKTGSNPRLSQWSTPWQLWINTATAVMLLVCSVLLENVRARNNSYVRSKLQEVLLVDCKVEALERTITGDVQDNAQVSVPPVKRTKFRKVISGYAQIVGTGVGFLLSCAVFGIWIAIGGKMKWDSGWWLIIGTYTGVVGFLDGFVLREVYYSMTQYESSRFEELLEDSQNMLDLAGISYRLKRLQPSHSIGYRVSSFANKICSSQWGVAAALVIIVVVIGIASGMHWSVTGQLLCNTPMMIIETFCLLVLIQAHNWADDYRRAVVREVALSRQLVCKKLEGVSTEN